MFLLRNSCWLFSTVCFATLVVSTSLPQSSQSRNDFFAFNSHPTHSASPALLVKTNNVRRLHTGPTPPEDSDHDEHAREAEEEVGEENDDSSDDGKFNRFDLLFLGVICTSMCCGLCDYLFRTFFGPDEATLLERRDKQRRKDTIQHFQKRNARLVSSALD